MFKSADVKLGLCVNYRFKLRKINHKPNIMLQNMSADAAIVSTKYSC